MYLLVRDLYGSVLTDDNDMGMGIEKDPFEEQERTYSESTTVIRELFNLFDTKSKGYVKLEDLDDLFLEESHILNGFDEAQLRLVFSILAQGSGQVTVDDFVFAFQKLLTESDQSGNVYGSDDGDEKERETEGGTFFAHEDVETFYENDKILHLLSHDAPVYENGHEPERSGEDIHVVLGSQFDEIAKDYNLNDGLQQEHTLPFSGASRVESVGLNCPVEAKTCGEDVFEGHGLLFIDDKHSVTSLLVSDSLSDSDDIPVSCTPLKPVLRRGTSEEDVRKGNVKLSFNDCGDLENKILTKNMSTTTKQLEASQYIHSKADQRNNCDSALSCNHDNEGYVSKTSPDWLENPTKSSIFHQRPEHQNCTKDEHLLENQNENSKEECPPHSNTDHIGANWPSGPDRPYWRLRRAQSTIENFRASNSSRRRRFHTTSSNWKSCDLDGSKLDILKDMPLQVEDWDTALKRLGGISIFGSNSNLRFLWQQLSVYHTDLLQPFEDFLRFVIEEIQKAYAKCQELENTLLSKSDQHEKEIAGMYEEMDQLLQKEREMLQDKHFEKEEHQKNDFNRALEIREHDLQEALKMRAELESKVESLQEDVIEVKTSRDRIERQLNDVSTNEYHLRVENECLRQEYDHSVQRLDSSTKTIRELQDQLLQIAKISEVDRENYRRCLRHYKDMMEEKEYLDMNINNMSHELQEMKSLNKSLLERMDSSFLNTSILWERQNEEDMPPPSPTIQEEIYDQTEESPYDLSVEVQYNSTMTTSTPVKRNPVRFASPKKGFKVIFVGDAAVGKTSLIKRMCRGSFDSTRTITTGPDCFTKMVQVDDNEVQLKLWDTVGQERFNSLPPSYFRNSDVVILMYDMAEEISFINAKSWMKTIHEYTDEYVTLVLVGNKIDLDHRREVKMDKAKKLANENDAIFMETSAKTNENVQNLLTTIASSILDKDDTLLIRETCVQVLDNFTPKSQKKKSCCYAL